MTVECSEYQDLISAFVDRRLQGAEMEELRTHLTQCSDCRFEYEMQSVTKALLATKTRRVTAPETLRLKVGQSIRRVPSPVGVSVMQWMRSWAKFSPRPVLVGGIVAAALTLYFVVPWKPVPAIRKASFFPDDVILQSIENFRAVSSGEIKPQVESSEPTSVEKFFSGKTEFPVLVPRLRDCKLIGGVLNEVHGVPLAHVVYKHGDHIVYMYQACWDIVVTDEKLHLPDNVKAELRRTGWFCESRADSHTVVVWLKGKTLCSAVAKISQADLLDCVKAVEESRGW